MTEATPKAAPVVLTGRQRRHLRALAHHLEPLVLVGKEGVSEGLVRATVTALEDHELIKVRLPQVEREERSAMARALIEATHASEVGVAGRVLTLYRRRREKPSIALPT